MNMNEVSIVTAECMGFCGGVKRAMQLFQEALENRRGEAVYVLHELVHNRTVTKEMEAAGAVFVESPGEIPCGSTVLIGAHGIAIEVEEELRLRAGRLIDATCPLVKQVQAAAASLSADEELVFHGMAGHPEAVGILSRAGTPHCFVVNGPEDAAALPELHKPALLAQTTLNHLETDAVFQALRERFPGCRRLGAICRASFERQSAVEKLVPQVEALVVIGSAHSSNANRLMEIGRAGGIPAWLVDDAAKLPPELGTFSKIGVSAGASTPSAQIESIISAIRRMYE